MQPPPKAKGVQIQDHNNGSRVKDREDRRNTLPNRERQRVARDLTNVRPDWKEFKLISFNVRGLNSESKQKIVYDLLKHNRPQMVCFSETKLQSPLYLGGFWSYQTMQQRSGGCWNASRTNTRL